MFIQFARSPNVRQAVRKPSTVTLNTATPTGE